MNKKKNPKYIEVFRSVNTNVYNLFRIFSQVELQTFNLEDTARLFFSAYFRLSPLQKHVRKVVGGFGKKSCVSTGVRKPGNTYASPTAMI